MRQKLLKKHILLPCCTKITMASKILMIKNIILKQFTNNDPSQKCKKEEEEE